MRKPSPHRAFTIVELTVVLTIVGILAAILFPVFAQARASARKTECLSHLYQIGLALQLYARDHDGRFPPRADDWTPLAQPYVPDLSLFTCAQDPLFEALRRANAGRSSADQPLFSSYAYRPGLTSEDPAELPLASDWGVWHNDAASILYLGGSVKLRQKRYWQPVSAGPRPLPAGVTPPPDPSPPSGGSDGGE